MDEDILDRDPDLFVVVRRLVGEAQGEPPRVVPSADVAAIEGDDENSQQRKTL
jgi:hypothetical protein